MARAFVSASSQSGSPASAPVTAAPLTFSCWYNPTTLAAQQSLMALGNSGSTTDRFVLYADPNATALRFFVQNAAGTNGQSSAITIFSANGVWHHCAGVAASATSRTVYADGVAATADTTNVTPSVDTLYVGTQRSSGSLSLFTNGALGEPAVWNAALTAAEIAALARGVSPLRIRPGSLVSYWPLWGFASPEPDLTANNRALTLTNTPAAANHAPVTLFTPKSRTYPQFDVSAGGLIWNPMIGPVDMQRFAA